MRIPILMLAALCAAMPGAARAQANPVVLAPDARIRFAVAPDAPLAIATVVARHGDSLWVRPEQATDTVAFRVSSLARLDVSRGKETHARHAAGVGFLLGAVAGAVDGFSNGQDCSGYDAAYPPCLNRGQSAATEAVLAGILGAAIGAIVGWVKPVERWNHIVPRAGGAVTVGPLRPGRSPL
jgi:hypothetical protein